MAASNPLKWGSTENAISEALFGDSSRAIQDFFPGHLGEKPADRDAEQRWQRPPVWPLAHTTKCFATLKFDGTNCGVDETGQCYGRNQLIPREAVKYQQKSIGRMNRCAALRGCEKLKETFVAATPDGDAEFALSPGEIQRCVVYGEFMCNPELYGYEEAGWAVQPFRGQEAPGKKKPKGGKAKVEEGVLNTDEPCWHVFGVVLELTETEAKGDDLEAQASTEAGSDATSSTENPCDAGELLAAARAAAQRRVGCKLRKAGFAVRRGNADNSIQVVMNPKLRTVMQAVNEELRAQNNAVWAAGATPTYDEQNPHTKYRLTVEDPVFPLCIVAPCGKDGTFDKDTEYRTFADLVADDAVLQDIMGGGEGGGGRPAAQEGVVVTFFNEQENAEDSKHSEYPFSRLAKWKIGFEKQGSAETRVQWLQDELTKLEGEDRPAGLQVATTFTNRLHEVLANKDRVKPKAAAPKLAKQKKSKDVVVTPAGDAWKGWTAAQKEFLAQTAADAGANQLMKIALPVYADVEVPATADGRPSNMKLYAAIDAIHRAVASAQTKYDSPDTFFAKEGGFKEYVNLLATETTTTSKDIVFGKHINGPLLGAVKAAAGGSAMVAEIGQGGLLKDQEIVKAFYAKLVEAFVMEEFQATKATA